MKKTSLIKISAMALCFGGATLFLQSCDKSPASLLKFNVPVQSGSQIFTIPPSDTAGTFVFPSASTTVKVDSVIRAYTGNALGIANISSVKITSCELQLSNATTASNFANFEFVNASLVSSTESTPFVLSITGNPDVFNDKLTLPIDSAKELKSYLGTTAASNTFTYGGSGKLRRKTTDSLKCTITYKFSVVVTGS